MTSWLRFCLLTAIILSSVSGGHCLRKTVTKKSKYRRSENIGLYIAQEIVDTRFEYFIIGFRLTEG